MLRAVRTALVKSTLSIVLVHTAIAIMVSPSTYRAIDKLRQALIWTGTNTVSGARCLVGWSKVARPTELGA
jgi:hypothetical protein